MTAAPNNSNLKRVLSWVAVLDVIAIGGFLALWFTTKNPVLAASPIALTAPILIVLLIRASKADKAAAQGSLVE